MDCYEPFQISFVAFFVNFLLDSSTNKKAAFV